ncbi:MAG: hypothetical protein IJ126_00430 [Lachnospiraceae bacterium]|nr:hypothetical protein [Lachnospiraceae bacterium]
MCDHLHSCDILQECFSMREAMAHCDNRAVRRQERCRRDNIEDKRRQKKRRRRKEDDEEE